MKDKKMMALIAVIVLLLFGLSFAKSRAPKPVDWEPNFINTKTTPYGTYITYESLEDIFQKKNIRSTRNPIYNNLKKEVDKHLSFDDEYNDYDSYEETSTSTDYDSYNEEEDSSGRDEDIQLEEVTVQPVPEDSSEIVHDHPTAWYHDAENITDTTSYIFINTKFELDNLDLEYLLDFVGLGNNVFISAEMFDSKLMDTLKIKTKSDYFEADTTYTLTDFKNKKYHFKEINSQTSFNMDSCQLPFRLLAQNNKGDSVFLDVTYGKGHIFLHAIPTAFANVNMLKTKKYDFGFRCLSYLPESNKIIWDEYQKQGMLGDGGDFKMMLSNPPLRIALYIILGGLLLFMIFRAKRVQRVIPIIKPPVNSSLEFLGTISNLYYRKKDLNTIVEKRHAYLLDFIRKNYYMPTERLDGEFLHALSAKSGVDEERIMELFNLYKDMSTLIYIPNDKFLKYNSLLEEFYKNVKNK